MAKKPTYEALEKRVKELEREAIHCTRTEEALKESEEKWRSLAETAPCVILMVKRDGTIQFLNRSVGDYTPEETIGRKVWEYVHPDHHRVMREAIEHVFQTGTPTGYEILGAGPGGPASSWYITKLGPIVREGQVVGLTMVSTDITANKRVQETLTECEERYRSLFEDSRDTVYITTREGEIVDMNQAGLDLFGYSREEIMGLNVLQLYAHPDDRPRFQKEIEKKGSVKDFALKLCRKDGTQMDCLLTSSVRLAYDGSTLGYQGIIRDITEQIQAEKALKESEAQKKAILDASIDRIRLVDKDMRIIWANETTTRKIKIAPEDLAGQHCYKIFVGRDTPCHGCPTKKALASGKFYRTVLHQPESAHIKKKIYWDTYTVPIKNESGDIVNLIQIARNITEAKRAEEELRESEEKYRTLFENANDAILITDTKTNIILDANRQAEELIGSPREEIIGMNQSNLHPPHYAHYYKNTFHRHVREGRVLNLEAEVITKDGTFAPVFISAGVISLHGKEVIQWLFRDITEERKILDLREEMAARKLVEKAKGILMDRHNISEKEAMGRLQKESRRQRKKIKAIAQAVISSELTLD